MSIRKYRRGIIRYAAEQHDGKTSALLHDAWYKYQAHKYGESKVRICRRIGTGKQAIQRRLARKYIPIAQPWIW